MTIRILAALTALFLLTAPVSAQTTEDATAIKSTILSQIDAMQADDWDKAFTFASPTIQGIFKSPYNFSEMVKRGYPMVWKPSDVQIGDLVETPRGPMQTMFFVDQEGRAYVADYLMQQIDGVWRINGVQIRPAESGSA
ncbi:MAG: DUF4864 domain-containing protein [Pseudomonadota bacterium]